MWPPVWVDVAVGDGEQALAEHDGECRQHLLRHPGRVLGDEGELVEPVHGPGPGSAGRAERPRSSYQLTARAWRMRDGADVGFPPPDSGPYTVRP